GDAAALEGGVVRSGLGRTRHASGWGGALGGAQRGAQWGYRSDLPGARRRRGCSLFYRGFQDKSHPVEEGAARVPTEALCAALDGVGDGAARLSSAGVDLYGGAASLPRAAGARL